VALQAETPHSAVSVDWNRNLNREHSQNPKPSWFGESVGHYENGELVIDTVVSAAQPRLSAFDTRGPVFGNLLPAAICNRSDDFQQT
jgi:hypothetical protein